MSGTKGCLLDVSVLVALSWPGHQFHETVQRWFARNAPKGWRAVSLTDALSALRGTVSHPAHQFWADDISFSDALHFLKGLTGHKQVTDAYLVGLAIHHKGKLATLDRGVARLAQAAGVVEVIA